MTQYRLESEAAVELDIQAALEWYENEEPGLGLEFLAQLRFAYTRIISNPQAYEVLRSGIRRALTRQFRTPFTFLSKPTSFWSLQFFTQQGIQRNGSFECSL